MLLSTLLKLGRGVLHCELQVRMRAHVSITAHLCVLPNDKQEGPNYLCARIPLPPHADKGVDFIVDIGPRVATQSTVVDMTGACLCGFSHHSVVGVTGAARVWNIVKLAG